MIEPKKLYLFTSFIMLLLGLSVAKAQSQGKVETLTKQSKDKIKEHDYLSAIDLLDKAIKLAPKKVNLYIDRAYARQRMSDSEGALEDYNTACKLNTKNPEVYFNRALLKGELEKHEDAVADLDQAIKLNENYKEAYYRRGLEYFKMKHFQESVADFNKVIEMDDKHALAYVGRANVKYKAGDKDGACEDVKKARDLGFTEAGVFIKKYCR